MRPFAFVKPADVLQIHHQQNTYLPHIQLTYEMESERKPPFLDVMIKPHEPTLETSVYHKKMNSNLNLNWNSHSPKSWQIGTLRNTTRCVIKISSPFYVDTELSHLRKVFFVVNQYPPQVTNKIIAE